MQNYVFVLFDISAKDFKTDTIPTVDWTEIQQIVFIMFRLHIWFTFLILLINWSDKDDTFTFTGERTNKISASLYLMGCLFEGTEDLLFCGGLDVW